MIYLMSGIPNQTIWDYYLSRPRMNLWLCLEKLANMVLDVRYLENQILAIKLLPSLWNQALCPRGFAPSCHWP